MNPGKIPRDKIKNPNVVVQPIVYLFGGSKLLQFDTKAIKISEVNPQPGVPIPKRTQCEYIPELGKIATLGGTIDGKITNVGYLFTPPNFATPETLPPFPKPIRYTTLAYYHGILYAVGGETEGGETKGLVKDVYSLKIKDGIGQAWEKVCDLPLQRRSANLIISNNTIYVMGGYSGDNLRSTQIDSIDLATKIAKMEPYRLPLGVEGSRFAWHGDYILMIGGKRIENNPDANVLVMNWQRKGLLSMRDLQVGRDYPLVIPTEIDEVVVIGGGHHKTAEKRSWDENAGDYSFRGIQVPGQELIENPSHYDSALPTFVTDIKSKEDFPNFGKDTRILFGNEIDCFVIEFPENLVANFYFSPLKLQQKTGQVALRHGHNEIYLIGGTDVSRTKISSKSYKFLIDAKEIVELGKMKHPRYFTQVVAVGNDFYAIAGKGKGGKALAECEKMTINVPKPEWVEIAPLSAPRFGHVAWEAGDKIFVIGGTTADKGVPVNTCEVYDVKANKWSLNPGIA